MKNCVINPKTRRAVKTSTKLGKSILAMLGESMGGHSVGVQAGGSSLANATPIAVVRKPRGRPRKAPASGSAVAVVKKPRGRPRKAPASGTPPAKKPRGRPRKAPASGSAVAVVKKPRGRPRKAPASGTPPSKKPRGRPRKAPVIVSASATGAPAQLAMLSKTPVRVMRNTSALAKSVPNVRGAKALSNRPSSAPAKNISGNYEPYFVPTINMSVKSKKSSTPKAVPIITPRRRVRVPLPPVRPPAGGNRAFVRRPVRQAIRTTYKTSS